jgi:putative tryptophan/tyrosine transport system substrate-binding protein
VSGVECRVARGKEKNMKRKVTFLALCAMLLALCVTATAQQPKKVPRIGYLSVLSPASDSARIEAFRQGLRQAGYTDGQNIAIESRYAEGKLNRLPDLAGELVRLKVDVIVVGGSTATRAVKMLPRGFQSLWPMVAIPLNSGL